MTSEFVDRRAIVIAGTGSNTGKTTLLCDLLRALADDGPCEAIKLSRGHYRSCGKDPQACCVSGLLGAEPTIRSGREATFVSGKDTGRYWEAGASDVHWVIATDGQVEQGIELALARVRAPRVLLEGTSLLKALRPTLAILVVRGDETTIKPSARVALRDGRIDALYLAEPGSAPLSALPGAAGLPVFHAADLPRLVALVRERTAHAPQDAEAEDQRQ